MLLPLFKALEAQGLDPEHLLSNQGWSIDGMTGAATIDQDFELQIVADALKMTDDPLLGLKVGAEASFTTYGIYAMLLMTAPTLLDAARASVQFQALSLLLSQMTMKMDKDWVEVFYFAPESEPRLKAFIIDRDMMGVYVFLRELLSPTELFDTKIRSSRAIPLPKEQAAFERYFEHEIEFGSAYSSFRIPRSILSRAQKHGNELAHKLYRVQAFEILSQLYTEMDDIAARVRQMLNGYESRYPSLTEMASMFRCSDRTLRRKLDESNTCYRDLLEEQKKSRVFDMLADRSISVNEMSDTLGYTEPASFLRAFKRWTGTTPKLYVKSQQ